MPCRDAARRRESLAGASRSNYPRTDGAVPPINFDNGATYEVFMGAWSRLVGDAFLDWLAPKPGLRWIDVGCGNGAFSGARWSGAARRSRCSGIDPSREQLDFATHAARRRARRPTFQIGDAMDAAVRPTTRSMPP